MQTITYSIARQVMRHRGTMPIILTCPHGGSLQPPNVDEREERDTPAACTGADKFVTGRDTGTLEITQALAQRIVETTGLSPYVVIAQFDRRYIDANRREQCAYTDISARPFYREYFGRIDGYVAQIRDENRNRGFLFDIHGFTNRDGFTANLSIGTVNGSTLVPPFIKAHMFERQGFCTLLAAARYPGQHRLLTVHPTRPTEPDHGPTNGGHTVRHYGSLVSSIQVEISRDVRQTAGLRDIAIDAIANAMVNSVRRHIRF